MDKEHNPDSIADFFRSGNKFKLDQTYTLEELLAKEKTDLEKLKLIAEMVKQKRRNNIELFKAFMIPVLVAVLTWLSTSFITHWNQKETALNNDKKYVRDIDMEIRRTTDLEAHRLWLQRLRFFENSATFEDHEILSILKENQQLLLSDLARRKQDSISAVAMKELNSTDKKDLAAIESNERQAQNAKILMQATKDVTEKKQLQAEIDKYNRKVDSLLVSSRKLKNAYENTKSLGAQTQAEIRAVEPVSAGNLETTPVYWFKEGNFLICFDTLKVLLNSIDEVNKTINFSVYYLDKDAQSNKNKIAENLTVSLGATIKLNESYTLKLVSIDHAGRNPFTMAAYISCSKLPAATLAKR